MAVVQPAPDRAASIRDWNWSPAEKKVARQAFDKALDGELQAVIRDTQTRAARISEPRQLWELEEYLQNQRKDIDSRYDYRYSVLPFVFADLIAQGRIEAHDLRGLHAKKIAVIRELARSGH